jgi:hypothetical protein
MVQIDEGYLLGVAFLLIKKTETKFEKSINIIRFQNYYKFYYLLRNSIS